MLDTDTPRSAPARREAHFGLRIPPDDTPAPFRVLIGARWLWASVLAAFSLLLGLLAGPRRWRWPLLLGTGGVGAGLFALAVAQARMLKPERVTLPIPDLPPELDGLRIVQISDLHLGRLFARSVAQRAIAWAVAQNPDLIAITGDFVSYTKHLPLVDECLRGIKARHGVYAVLGNHDYWTDIDQIERSLTAHGIDLLRNERRSLWINGTTLQVVGVDCIWEARHDLDYAFGSPRVHLPTIVLAHEPDIADKVAPYGPLLQLSGHTHAGHIALPGLGPFFLPRHGFRYFRGLQRIGGMWLYVSRGIGGIPLRLGAPPEVTELTLIRSNENGAAH